MELESALDAHSLRRQVGQQATALNALTNTPPERRLRERMGHSRLEIAAGAAVAWAVNRLCGLWA